MDSIKKIEKLSPDAAIYFVDTAFRHFCLWLLEQPENISMVDTYRLPFQAIAKEYLAWDDQQMRQALDKLDSEQTKSIRNLLGEQITEEDAVDWDAVEQKVNQRYGHYLPNETTSL